MIRLTYKNELLFAHSFQQWITSLSFVAQLVISVDFFLIYSRTTDLPALIHSTVGRCPHAPISFFQLFVATCSTSVVWDGSLLTLAIVSAWQSKRSSARLISLRGPLDFEIWNTQTTGLLYFRRNLRSMFPDIVKTGPFVKTGDSMRR